MFSIKKISYKIVFWLVLVSFLLTGIGSSIVIYYEYNLELEKFNQEINDIKNKNKNSLQNMLWFYDKNSVQLFLRDTVATNKISYASITLNDNSILEAGDKENKNVLIREFRIMHYEGKHEYHVGHFIVHGNLNQFTEILSKKTKYVLVTEFFKAIFMSIFVIWLLKYIIINYLERLAKKTKEVNISNIHTPIFLKNKNIVGDEIDIVLDSFNEMRNNLFKEILKTNKTQKDLIAFKNAVENSFNVIVITDTHKNIRYVNDAFEEVTGYSRSEVLGKNPNILKSNLMLRSTYIQMYRCLEKGQRWDGEFINKRKDGSLLYEKASIIPVIIDGKIDSYLSIKLDISQYKESEAQIRKLNKDLEARVEKRTEELKESVNSLLETKEQLLIAEKSANKARIKAEKANKAKSVFLANISHELKTPLNGIVGLVYLNKKNTENKQSLENLNKINLHSNNLLRLIGDLLDASKLEAKEVTIKKDAFGLIEMIKLIKQQYKEKYNFKDIEFNLIYDKSIPHIVVGDSVRVYQVITNLLNNAFKFTDRGNISLDVEILNVSRHNIKLQFRVKDDGIGIEKEDLANLFDSFYQTKISQENYMEGSGLGLNICKNLVNQMGGEIWVHSEIGKGSSFYFSLDFDISNEKTKKQTYKVASFSEDNVVLVVDDKELNRDVVGGILDSINIKYETANNGLEALKKIKTTEYKLILLDVKMPIMDGWECSSEIRKKYTKEELPIIIISANESANYIKEEEYSLINDYIEKPINPEVFINILSRFLKVKKEEGNTIAKQLTKNNKLDIVDALDRFMSNEELYVKTLNKFVNTYKSKYKDDLLNLLALEDKTKAIDYLHTLKGLVGNIAAKELFKLIKNFHDDLKNGKDYVHYIDKYIKLFEELFDQIKKYTANKKEIVVKNNLDISEKEVLDEILKYSKIQSTKAIKFFNEVKGNFIDNKLFKELDKALSEYDFQKCISLIEEKNL